MVALDTYTEPRTRTCIERYITSSFIIKYHEKTRIDEDVI